MKAVLREQIKSDARGVWEWSLGGALSGQGAIVVLK